MLFSENQNKNDISEFLVNTSNNRFLLCELLTFLAWDKWKKDYGKRKIFIANVFILGTN